MSNGDLTGRLQTHVDERNTLLERLVSILSRERYVAAAWLYGSLSRDTADAFSDIDIRIMFRDIESDEEMRNSLYRQIGEPLMVFDAPQNRPPGGAFNMCWYDGVDGPHAMDLTWEPAEGNGIASDVKLLLNPAGLPATGQPMQFAYQPIPPRSRVEELTQDVNGFWSMLLIVGKYVARNPHEARMGLLQWTIPQLRDAQSFVGVAPVTPYEEMPDHPDPAVKLEIMRGLAHAARTIAPALSEAGVTPLHAFVDPAMRFLDLVEAVALSK